MKIESKPETRWTPFPVKFGDRVVGLDGDTRTAFKAGFYLRKGTKIDNGYLFPTKRQAIGECLRRNGIPNQLGLYPESRELSTDLPK